MSPKCQHKLIHKLEFYELVNEWVGVKINVSSLWMSLNFSPNLTAVTFKNILWCDMFFMLLCNLFVKTNDDLIE